MPSRKITTLATIVCAFVVYATTAYGQKMYWTDQYTDKIQRANLDGSDVEDLVVGSYSLRGITLDVQAGKMYWIDPLKGPILRSDLDGANEEIVVRVTGLLEPEGIALDLSRGKVYWTERATRKIKRANLDGSNVENVITTGLTHPYGIALDPAGGKMYWTDQGRRKIQRADLEGTNIEDLVTEPEAKWPVGIDLDVSAGKMYWTDLRHNPIHRANLDGSNIEHLVTTGLERPSGISLDPVAGKMYWTDRETDKIQRANLDGSDVEDLVITGLEYPFDITLDLTCPYEGPDCQPNDIPDACDIARTISPDCNGNGIPDECDIASGTSEDCDGDDIPDVCGGAVRWDRPTIEFVPSGSTGSHYINCNEITIPAGGVQIELEVRISAWGTAPGNPALGSYNIEFLGDSVLGVNADPPNPGVDLTIPLEVECTTAGQCPVPSPAPVTQTETCGMFEFNEIDITCDDSKPGFIIGQVCSDDLMTPCRTHTDCPPGGFCVDNPRYVFGDLGGAWWDVWPFWTHNIVQWLGLGIYGAQQDTDVSRSHAGKLRLIVPEDAHGIYTIRLDRGGAETFLNDGENFRIPDLVITDGQLTISGACCMADGSCIPVLDRDCPEAGGTSIPGAVCEEDTDGDGVVGVCGDECPDDAGKLEPGQCGCGNLDDDTDADGVADCVDLCPDDPNKTEPGWCGCGRADTGDVDGDGVPDCADQCEGADDGLFAPECFGAIPTASGWGLIAMTLLLLSAGKVYFGRRLVR